jgi:hypothetical protein
LPDWERPIGQLKIPVKRLSAISPLLIPLVCLLLLAGRPASGGYTIRFDFFGEAVQFEWDPALAVGFQAELSESSIQQFYSEISQKDYSKVISALKDYKSLHKPDDWLFYQLIRKTAQQISPKAANYQRYTLYKWYFLQQTGYDAILAISGDKVLFYVQSDEVIYNIPSRMSGGRQYICLNFHDYPGLDLQKEQFEQVTLPVANKVRGFSYKVTQLPQFDSSSYEERDIRFRYYQSEYKFRVKLNPQVKSIFANYPVVDYEYYFNIPMSQETYGSLIPALRKNLAGMNIRSGVDYLMRFTRYAFLYRPDTEIFGDEKRLSPEQTLLYEQSDCDDRAALFFYLVKEIYDLPMLVLAYPKHVTIAVQLDKPVGKPILYNGQKYSICEPTPQKEDLLIGQLASALMNEKYEVVYAYQPGGQ